MRGGQEQTSSWPSQRLTAHSRVCTRVAFQSCTLASGSMRGAWGQAAGAGGRSGVGCWPGAEGSEHPADLRDRGLGWAGWWPPSLDTSSLSDLTCIQGTWPCAWHGAGGTAVSSTTLALPFGLSVGLWANGVLSIRLKAMGAVKGLRDICRPGQEPCQAMGVGTTFGEGFRPRLSPDFLSR